MIRLSSAFVGFVDYGELIGFEVKAKHGAAIKQTPFQSKEHVSFARLAPREGLPCYQGHFWRQAVLAMSNGVDSCFRNRLSRLAHPVRD